MQKILFTNVFAQDRAAYQQIYDRETGTASGLPQWDGDEVRLAFFLEGGRKACFSRVRYNLRDDMAVKLRYRYEVVDLATGEHREMFSKWDRSGFQTAAILPRSDGRFFVVTRHEYTDTHVYLVSFDGDEVEEIWHTAAYPYGFVQARNGDLAFHTALYDEKDNPDGLYAITVWDGNGRRRIVSEPGHLFFGPEWSPDEERLAFVDCIPETDPGHLCAAVCVCRRDGSDFRRITAPGTHYFATSFGRRDADGVMQQYGGRGSNWIQWTPEGKILYSRGSEGWHPDVRYDGTQRNHEELVYDEAAAKGGCCFAEIDPDTGEERTLTKPEEGQWDFRAALRPDGKEILFTRRRIDGTAVICTLDRETLEVRELISGLGGLGADHPQYLKTEYEIR